GLRTGTHRKGGGDQKRDVVHYLHLINSSSSPGCVPVSAEVPAGSSNTECAIRHIDIRRRTMSFLIFRTFRFLLRYKTSIGNFMPNVWTASHGTIQMPWPFGRLACLSRPVRLLLLVSAISIASPSKAARVLFSTR